MRMVFLLESVRLCRGALYDRCCLHSAAAAVCRYMFVCVACGLWGGLAIGLQTEYFTSNRYRPVQDVADACRTGPATDIIFGLALGYKSTIIPCFVIAITIYIANSLAGAWHKGTNSSSIPSAGCCMALHHTARHEQLVLWGTGSRRRCRCRQHAVQYVRAVHAARGLIVLCLLRPTCRVCNAVQVCSALPWLPWAC